MAEESKKSIFKRWWFWTIVVVLLIGIGANLDDEEETSKNNDSEPASSQVDNSNNNDSDNNVDENTNDNNQENDASDEGKTEFGVNEEIEFENRIIEVTDIEYSQGGDFDTPKDGMEYVIVTVSITNNSDDELSYNPFHFKMQNSNGQIESQTFTIVDSDTSLSSGDLASGGNVSGTIAFEQPVDDPDLKLIFEPSFWTNKRVTIDLN